MKIGILTGIVIFFAAAYGSFAETAAPAESLAIFDFTDSRGYITDETKKIALLIFSELSGESKIRLIERSEVDKVLEEQNLSQSGLVSNDSTLKLGKTLGADNILTGKIYYMDGKIYFNGKLSDCRTGKITGVSMSYDSEDNKDVMYETFAKKIAEHIVKKFTGF